MVLRAVAGMGQSRVPGKVEDRTVLSGISVMCFAASYAVVLALEVSRLFFRLVARTPLRIGFTIAGLFANVVYLALRFRQLRADGLPLLNWYTGCLALSALLVLVYLLGLRRRRRSTAGLVLLPTSLVLIGMAHAFPDSLANAAIWSVLHGVSLGVGMALVAMGFGTGLLYLYQSWRLKRHRVMVANPVWLPSLEQLQRSNERFLLASLALLGFGLMSGIGLNMLRARDQGIPWSDPVVLASLVWLIWLLAVAIFSGVYRPAREGRKVAYLTLGSFVFLALVLGIMGAAPSKHGAAPSDPATSGFRESSEMLETREETQDAAEKARLESAGSQSSGPVASSETSASSTGRTGE